MQTVRPRTTRPACDRRLGFSEKTDFSELLTLGPNLDGFNLEWIFDQFEQHGGWQ